MTRRLLDGSEPMPEAAIAAGSRAGTVLRLYRYSDSPKGIHRRHASTRESEYLYNLRTVPVLVPVLDFCFEVFRFDALPAREARA
jgi:hypothetical protein